MSSKIGIGRKRLVDKIINDIWKVEPENKIFTYNDLLYIIQEMMEGEGGKYTTKSLVTKFQILKDFEAIIV